MIKVKIKFRMYEDMFTEETAQMVVKYKKPGKIFSEKLLKNISCTVISNGNWNSRKYNPEFYNEVQNFMSDHDNIKKIAKEMILKDIKTDNAHEDTEKSHKEAEKLLKNLSIQFEFEEKK